MVPASACISTIEWAPPDVCCQCLCPQGESLLPPSSMTGSLRATSGSDPDSFQTTASVLGLRMCESLRMPFKSGVCFLWTSRSPICKPCWMSKPGILVQALDLGSQMWNTALAPGGELPQLCFSSYLWATELDVGEFWLYCPLTFLHILLWLLLCVFSCGKSFLLVFKLFS